MHQLDFIIIALALSTVYKVIFAVVLFSQISLVRPRKNFHFNLCLYSAVYTGIKKPESFSHSGFSLKVARQLPLNTPKNPNRKTHLRSVIF